jgi:hypothetical protein
MTIWQVQLEGDARDLDFLVKICITGQYKVLRDENTAEYLYESASFYSCTLFEEVERLAEEELAVLSGILKLERNGCCCLKFGAVYRPNQSGGRDIFVRIRESLQVRAEVGSVTAVVIDAAGNVITQPETAPPRLLVLLQLAARDAAVAKVLRLLSTPDAMSWVGLYRIKEVIENDVGGQHKFKAKGWGSLGDLRRFDHSANSVQVGGDKSRHGKEPQMPPKNPMTPEEAEAYVKYIVQAWLVWKCM